MRVIVTGGAAGIGKAIVHRLAKDSVRDGEPAQIVIADIDAAKAGIVADELGRQGAQIAVVVADMSDPEAPDAIVARAKAAFGGLDVVVSNVGFSAAKPLEELGIADWDRVFAANVRAAWLLAKASYEHLLASRGTFVAITSIAGIEPQPGLGPYTPSKAALIGLIQQLAVEWGPRGIRVNGVAPGATVTDKTGRIYDSEAVLKSRGQAIPLGRPGLPEDVAGAVSFLVGRDAAYCNGLNLVVDGGLLHTPISTGLALPPIVFKGGS